VSECPARFTAGDIVLICDRHLFGSIFEEEVIHSAGYMDLRWTWTDSESDSPALTTEPYEGTA
jgi:hypothetical protein